jgi:N-acyl homoserine lactone hydrolase
VRALDPELVWLAHEHEPWRPRTDPGNVSSAA